MGTPAFAVESLNALIANNFNVVAVVTSPDRRAGRGKKIQQSEVKQFALQHDLPVLQPEKLKASEFIEALQGFNADLFLVVAFRMLPEIVWQMPPKGTVNLHASLLPQYRGAAPINWAIINGEQTTGVTTFFIEKQIDTGSILLQKELVIAPDENAGQLHDRLMVQGADLLVETVKRIEAGNIRTTEQNQLMGKVGQIKKAPKIFKPDCEINWQWPTAYIYNFIRGLSPYPVAWTKLRNTKTGEIVYLRIFSSRIIEEQVHARAFLLLSDSKTYLHVKTSDGLLELLEVQLQGKKRLPIAKFLAGFQLADYVLGIG